MHIVPVCQIVNLPEEYSGLIQVAKIGFPGNDVNIVMHSSPLTRNLPMIIVPKEETILNLTLVNRVKALWRGLELNSLRPKSGFKYWQWRELVVYRLTNSRNNLYKAALYKFFGDATMQVRVLNQSEVSSIATTMPFVSWPQAEVLFSRGVLDRTINMWGKNQCKVTLPASIEPAFA